ncbi:MULTISPECIES: PLP-dependent aminotransferase family protein [unclassified Xanthobacter]|uniref:MocR-like pyridoxine biosynthesis transcription factor PdxR n=1 Tax=unclassified Xanthobacter TaxID=2623496 RepID=UPI001F214583|nr:MULTISPECIES: PLP-dependent aminotransferase family protein [unclassified Xanthobacter]
MLPIPLDRHSAVTLQEQICEALRARIACGALPGGAQLSATRELARALGVSRNTAVLAYERLASEGFVEMRPHRGVFVADPPPGAPPMAEPLPAPAEAPTGAAGPHLITREDARPIFDLWYARPDPRLFPAHAWRQLGHAALGACAVGLSTYGPVGGEPRLRQAIADHLAVHRGLAVRPEQVVVTSGAQEALNLIARLLLEPGDTVVVEDPGYEAAAQVFEAHGARIVTAPVDGEGLVPALAPGLRPRLIYVTPAHQFPTGVVMSPARRAALLATAARHDALVVEDDYDGDILLEGPPAAALAALDGGRRTIFVGTFSKTLGCGLRLGYMVVPPHLAAAAEATKSLMSYGQSWLDQQILAAFLSQARYQRHLNRLRTACRARRDAALAGLRETFGNTVAVSGGAAGLHLYCTLPDGAPEAARLAAAALAVGVGLHPAEACGVHSATRDLSRTLLIGFGGLTPEELALAFTRLRQALAPAAARPCGDR